VNASETLSHQGFRIRENQMNDVQVRFSRSCTRPIRVHTVAPPNRIVDHFPLPTTELFAHNCT